MQNNFNRITQKAKRITLLPHEKKEMRANLELFMAKYPVRKVDDTRLLLQERSEMSTFAGWFTLKPLISKLQPMVIALIIALLVGGGTSFAAQGTLPGDILYPIKVSVNEEVRGWIAISDEAQAKWDARRAEKRLEEAEELAAQGRLDAQTSADIESRFEGHAEAFGRQAEKIEAKQKTSVALEVHSNFEASLKAHEQILAQIVAKKESTRAEIQPILVKTRVQQNLEAKARSDNEAKVSAEAGVEFQAAAEGKLKAAENKIAEVRGFISRIKTSVSANVTAEAEAKLEAAEEVVARGKVRMEAKAYGEAFTNFQEAIRVAQEAQLVAKTENELKIEIDAPSVNIRVNGGEKVESNGQMQNNSEPKGSPSGSGEVRSQTEVKSGNGSTNIKGNGEVKIDIGL